MSDSFQIQGRTVTFPIEVGLARMANAVYTVPAEAVAGLIDDPAFRPTVDDHGAASVVIGFVDYVENDLGDYNEIMWALMAEAADGSHPGTYIWRLPVDQEFTREAGVRMLGLPKTVESITIERDATSATATLAVDGQMVLRQRFPLVDGVAGVPMPSPTVCLSTVAGVASVSESYPTGSLRMAFGDDGYTLELGDHPWADELRRMGLAEIAPTVVTVCDDWASSFAPPQPL